MKPQYDDVLPSNDRSIFIGWVTAPFSGDTWLVGVFAHYPGAPLSGEFVYTRGNIASRDLARAEGLEVATEWYLQNTPLPPEAESAEYVLPILQRQPGFFDAAAERKLRRRKEYQLTSSRPFTRSSGEPR